MTKRVKGHAYILSAPFSASKIREVIIRVIFIDSYYRSAQIEELTTWQHRGVSKNISREGF